MGAANHILGVDHVGIGVRDMDRMRSFYRDALGFSRVLAVMPEADHRVMHELVRGTASVHSGVLMDHGGDGLSAALFRSTDPVPRPIRNDARYGDIGTAKMSIAVPDVDVLYEEKRDIVRFFSRPKKAHIPGPGDYRFVYGRDPEGNLVEFVSAPDNGVGHRMFLRSVGLSVTDLERSIIFYRENLGFDTMVIPKHRAFSGLVDEISGSGNTEVESCVLGNSRGKGTVELFEVTRPRGRSIPFGVQWGDFGYLQVCLHGIDREAIAAQMEAHGVEVLLPFRPVDDPEYPASFMYLRDPDGIPIEILVASDRR